MRLIKYSFKLYLHPIKYLENYKFQKTYTIKHCLQLPSSLRGKKKKRKKKKRRAQTKVIINTMTFFFYFFYFYIQDRISTLT